MRLLAVAVIIWAASVLAASDTEIENLNAKKEPSESTRKCDVEDEDAENPQRRSGIATADSDAPNTNPYNVNDVVNKDEISIDIERRPSNQIIQPYLVNEGSSISVRTEGENRSTTHDESHDTELASTSEPSDNVPRHVASFSRRMSCTNTASGSKRCTPAQEEDDESVEYEATEDFFLRQVQSFGQRVRPSSFVDHRHRQQSQAPVYYSFEYSSTPSRPEESKRHDTLYRANRFRDFASARKPNDSFGESAGNSLVPREPNRTANDAAKNGEDSGEIAEAQESFDAKRERPPAGTMDDDRANDESVERVTTKMYRKKKLKKLNDGTVSTNSDNPFESSLSLGRLFGPIVVPDVPQIGKSLPSGTASTAINISKSTRDDTASYPVENRVTSSDEATVSPHSTGSESHYASTTSSNEVSTVTESSSTIDEESNKTTDDVAAKTDAKLTCLDHISSMILNPLQAGIALVNAGNAYFVSNSSEKASGMEELAEEASNPEESKQTAVNQVETVKSIEIYHNAPVQEIHYPVELVPRLVAQQTYDSYRNVETNNLISAQYQPAVYKNIGNYVTDGKPQDFRENNQQVYNAVDEKLNRVVNAPPATTFQQIPSVLVHEDSQNAGSPSEQTVNDEYISSNRYDDALYGQSTVRHAFGLSQGQLKVTGNALKQDATRHRTKPYAFNAVQDYSSYVPHQEAVQVANANRAAENQNYGSLDAVNQPAVVGGRKPSKLSSDSLIPPDNSGSRWSKPQSQIYLIEKAHQNNHVPLADTKFVVPIPQPYPVEKIIEKTVHVPHPVPHPVEVEKLIERRVPYPLEKIVEKQVRIPEPYLMLVQVPIDRIVEKQIRVPHPYPIHVEKVIEKKVPYAVQRLIVQPFPVHVKVPQPYPAGVEKLAEKKMHQPHAIPGEPENSADRYRSYPTEVTKFLVNPLLAHLAYEAQHGPGYQQANQFNASFGFANKPRYEPESRSGSKERVSYASLSRQPVIQGSKRFLSRSAHSYPNASPYQTFDSPNASGNHRRQSLFPIKDKEKSIKDVQNSLTIPSKLAELAIGSTQPTVAPATVKRVRQSGTSSFRQSKMEYGFKPPMVPSIQYDENTATKVDN